MPQITCIICRWSCKWSHSVPSCSVRRKEALKSILLSSYIYHADPFRPTYTSNIPSQVPPIGHLGTPLSQVPTQVGPHPDRSLGSLGSLLYTRGHVVTDMKPLCGNHTKRPPMEIKHEFNRRLNE